MSRTLIEIQWLTLINIFGQMVVAQSAERPRFESSHWQKFIMYIGI